MVCSNNYFFVTVNGDLLPNYIAIYYRPPINMDHIYIPHLYIDSKYIVVGLRVIFRGPWNVFCFKIHRNFFHFSFFPSLRNIIFISEHEKGRSLFVATPGQGQLYIMTGDVFYQHADLHLIRSYLIMMSPNFEELISVISEKEKIILHISKEK